VSQCECFDCTDGEREIPRAGGWDDAARLSVCADGGSRCDPDQCMDDIAECCADGKVCPGHSCAKWCAAARARAHARTPFSLALKLDGGSLIGRLLATVGCSLIGCSRHAPLALALPTAGLTAPARLPALRAAPAAVCPHPSVRSQCADCTPSPRTHPVQLRPIASLSPSDPCSKCGFCGALECAKCAWCNREDVEAAFGSNVTQTAALPLLAHAAASAASHGGAALAVGAVVVLGALAAVLALAGGARRKAARAAMRAVSPPARDASERLLEVEEEHN
jgi:hypothetical protein